jgi:hypothetical protein
MTGSGGSGSSAVPEDLAQAPVQMLIRVPRNLLGPDDS